MGQVYLTEQTAEEYQAGLVLALKKAADRAIEQKMPVEDRVAFVSGWMSNKYPEVAEQLTRLWEGR